MIDPHRQENLPKLISQVKKIPVCHLRDFISELCNIKKTLECDARGERRSLFSFTLECARTEHTEKYIKMFSDQTFGKWRARKGKRFKDDLTGILISNSLKC